MAHAEHVRIGKQASDEFVRHRGRLNRTKKIKSCAPRDENEGQVIRPLRNRRLGSATVAKLC
jgi:hypothetical protein